MLRAFRERDVRIPEDISVIVFDEHPIAGYLAPALTTIKMPLREMGALATRMLIGAIMGETHAQMVMVEEPSELVERASVAPVSGSAADESFVRTMTVHDPATAPRERESGYKGDAWSVTLPTSRAGRRRDDADPRHRARQRRDRACGERVVGPIGAADGRPGPRPIRRNDPDPARVRDAVPRSGPGSHRGVAVRRRRSRWCCRPAAGTRRDGRRRRVSKRRPSSPCPGRSSRRSRCRWTSSRAARSRSATCPWCIPVRSRRRSGRPAGVRPTAAGGSRGPARSDGGRPAPTGRARVARIVPYPAPRDGLTLPLDTGQDSLFILAGAPDPNAPEPAPVPPEPILLDLPDVVDVHRHPDVDEYILRRGGAGYILNGRTPGDDHPDAVPRAVPARHAGRRLPPDRADRGRPGRRRVPDLRGPPGRGRAVRHDHGHDQGRLPRR